MVDNPFYSSSHAFTLVELMISIAVVSILSVIAIPSIQTALTQAQISKTITNLHTVRDGIELYAADRGHYPKGSTEPPTSLFTDYDAQVALQPLIGNYLPNQEKLLIDFFSHKAVAEFKKSIQLDLSSLPDYVGYSYFNYQKFLVPPRKPNNAFALISMGPDGKDSGLGVAMIKPSIVPSVLYSPTNGIDSNGDIAVGSTSLGIPLHD